MSTMIKIRSVRAVQEVCHVLLCCALMTGVTYAQGDETRVEKVPLTVAKKDGIADVMERLQQGNFFPEDIDRIARAGAAIQAISELKKKFELIQDQTSKDSVASALVRLGDKDPAAWDYLVQGAADAIASDAPPPQQFDSYGKMLPEPSPRFIAWAKARNLTTDAALDTAMRIYRAS